MSGELPGLRRGDHVGLCVGGEFQPFMARQAHQTVGIGNVNHQRIVAKHWKAVLSKSSHERGLACSCLAGESQHRSVERDRGGMDRQ